MRLILPHSEKILLHLPLTFDITHMCDVAIAGVAMSKALKKEMLNLPISFRIKQALNGMADRENRSMVNAFESS